MDYFYTPPHNITADSLTIEGEEFTHLTHVMRKKIGDGITVVDGVGTAFHSRITAINKRTARCEIHQRNSRLHEPSVDVTLAVGMLKNPSRFDFLVEKGTELGASHIVPLLTERTIVKHTKTSRWQKIALAAMKQSGRCVLPTIHAPTQFTSFVTNNPAELKLIAHEKFDNTRVFDKSAVSIVICIGPEGGFSEEEIDMASAGGFTALYLGERRLRTETAAIIAMHTVME